MLRTGFADSGSDEVGESVWRWAVNSLILVLSRDWTMLVTSGGGGGHSDDGF